MGPTKALGILQEVEETWDIGGIEAKLLPSPAQIVEYRLVELW